MGSQVWPILLYSRGDEQMAYQLAESEVPPTAGLDWLSAVIQTSNQVFQQPELQVELKQRGGFTDIQWRILSDFLFKQTAGKNEFVLK